MARQAGYGLKAAESEAKLLNESHPALIGRWRLKLPNYENHHDMSRESLFRRHFGPFSELLRGISQVSWALWTASAPWARGTTLPCKLV